MQTLPLKDVDFYNEHSLYAAFTWNAVACLPKAQGSKIWPKLCVSAPLYHLHDPKEL